jgi:excisionase family DNA binding protein
MTLWEVFRGEEKRKRLAASERKEPKGRNPFVGLLTVKKVAERKGTSQPAVVKAINRGELPAWEAAGQFWVREQDLDLWKPVRGQGRRTDKD